MYLIPSPCLSLFLSLLGSFQVEDEGRISKNKLWKGTSLCNIGAGSHNEGLMLYSVPHLLCVHVQEVHHYYTINSLTVWNHPEDIHAETSCNSGIHRKWRSWAHSCILFDLWCVEIKCSNITFTVTWKH